MVQVLDKKNITNNEAGMTLPGLLDKELERCWDFFYQVLKADGEAKDSNVKSAWKRIVAMHDVIEKLAEKYPDETVLKSIKDLQDHAVDQLLLKEKMDG